MSESNRLRKQLISGWHFEEKKSRLEFSSLAQFKANLAQFQASYKNVPKDILINAENRQQFFSLIFQVTDAIETFWTFLLFMKQTKTNKLQQCKFAESNEKKLTHFCYKNVWCSQPLHFFFIFLMKYATLIIKWSFCCKLVLHPPKNL